MRQIKWQEGSCEHLGEGIAGSENSQGKSPEAARGLGDFKKRKKRPMWL